MLHRIELHKFKCYKRHYVTFKELSLVVGENNAGKSTLIEALRLVSIVTQRFKNLVYRNPPEWTEQYFNDKGVIPSLKSIEYSSDNVIYSLDDPPAKIIAIFKNKVKIVIFLDENSKIFAQIFDKEGRIVTSKAHARTVEINPIKILPQIGPLQKTENLLNRSYVAANELTSLSSLHFRNQIQYNYHLYEDYRRLMAQTWPSISVHSFIRGNEVDESAPSLLIRDRSFVTEASKMGHGLQMWLQIIWFLMKCHESDTVILDEPDVYLHADIQRKLIRIIRGRFKQLVVATHSIEMMAEVPSDSILIIDKEQTKSRYATNSLAVQEIIESIGSIHNIELVRLWSSERFLIFEGESDDIKYLKVFQDIINPNSDLPLDNIPHTFTNGWGGWQRVVGAQRVISQNSNVETYCIFDSDYHTDEEIAARYESARDFEINIHIWKKKELENYLINKDVLLRYINEKAQPQITESELLTLLHKLCDEMKEDVFESYATEIQNTNRGKSFKSASQIVKDIMKRKWTSLDNQLSLISGKQFLKNLSTYLQSNHKVTLQKFGLAREFRPEEINQEIIDVIMTIESKSQMTNEE